MFLSHTLCKPNIIHKQISFIQTFMPKKEGFTLIELIMVIVILGILAAVAIPKFAGLTKEAKVSAVKGFAANLRAAANIVYSKWLLQDNSSLDNITLEDGSGVKVCAGRWALIGYGCRNGCVHGYPVAKIDGITKAINFDNSTFLVVPRCKYNSNDIICFCYKGFSTPKDNCYVEYDYSNLDKGPMITYDVSGCK